MPEKARSSDDTREEPRISERDIVLAQATINVFKEVEQHLDSVNPKTRNVFLRTYDHFKNVTLRDIGRSPAESEQPDPETKWFEFLRRGVMQNEMLKLIKQTLVEETARAASSPDEFEQLRDYCPELFEYTPLAESERMLREIRLRLRAR